MSGKQNNERYHIYLNKDRSEQNLYRHPRLQVNIPISAFRKKHGFL
jgi:hypothetical protein